MAHGDSGGRPSATSPHELAAAAQQLFLEKGFDETSVEDIASAVGVSRRTFFRYFPTKADVLWVESPSELARLRENLAADDGSAPYEQVLTRSIVAALTYPSEQHQWAYQRAQLVLKVPSVQTHASFRFAEWKDAAAEFAAIRSGSSKTDLFPIAVGHAVLAAMLTAHEYWIGGPGRDLPEALESTFSMLLPGLPTR
jgi:mycofactocin system transcriptional regulator